MADNNNGSALLVKKRALLDELLRVTKEAVIVSPAKDGEPGNEAEVFANFYGSRAPLLSELSELQKSLSSAALTAADKTISDECDVILNKIIEIDKRNLETGKEIADSVKDGIRRVNVARNINKKYSNPSATDGRLVDNKN